MSANSTYASPTPVAQFVNGADLTPGQYVRLIATGDGKVVNSSTFLLVTDYADKKGNKLVANTATGETALASAGSIWSTQG